MQPAGVGLGQLLLALDTTIASLVEAPRGLDPGRRIGGVDRLRRRCGSVWGRGADSADVFFLLGVADDEAPTLDRQPAPVGANRRWPSSPRSPLTRWSPRAVATGTAVVAVEPRARLGAAVCTDWSTTSSNTTAIANDPRKRLRHRLVRSGASPLARPYSRHGQHRRRGFPRGWPIRPSNDEADDLRRLSILGRAGPPEHLKWIGQWGHLRRAAGPAATWVRGRRAAGVGDCDHGWLSAFTSRASTPAAHRISPERSGWQAGPRGHWADDAEEVLRGATVAGGPHHVPAGGQAVDGMRYGPQQAAGA